MSSGPKTSTVVNDPWSGMPVWMKDSLKGRTEQGDQLFSSAMQLPMPQILDMNEKEYAAYNQFQKDAARGDVLSGEAAKSATANSGGDALDFLLKGGEAFGFGDRVSQLGGYDHGYTPGKFDSGYKKGPGYDGGYAATDFTGASGYEVDPSAYDNTYTGKRLTKLLGGKDFGLDYTDNVVDTTLTGMQRQADRDRLLRQSQTAATGGVSNTRAAVADAVAGGETARAMAEAEAKLRDSAQRFGTDSLFRQAEALDQSDQFKSKLDLDVASKSDESRRFAAEQALKEAGLTDDAARFLSQQTLTEQELAEGDSRFGAEMALKEQGMLDSALQALGKMNLNEQELENLAKQFGLNFDKDLLGMGQDAKQFGMGYDLDKASTLENLADSGVKRGSAVYDIMKMFGAQERGLDQAREDQPKNHLGWLADMLNGTHMAATNPVGSTTTQTTPGNSAMQNVLGIGSSLAGAWLMSDERVKEDVTESEESALDKLARIGRKPSKEYRYKDGYGHTKGRTTGLMAQDLEQAGIVGAVQEIDGIKHVDPYPVLATVVQAVNELSAKERAA